MLPIGLIGGLIAQEASNEGLETLERQGLGLGKGLGKEILRSRRQGQGPGSDFARATEKEKNQLVGEHHGTLQTDVEELGIMIDPEAAQIGRGSRHSDDAWPDEVVGLTNQIVVGERIAGIRLHLGAMPGCGVVGRQGCRSSIEGPVEDRS